MQKIKWAFILAANAGTRMRPLSKYLPKVLLPVQGKPMIINQIERLEQHGIENVIILLEPNLGPMIERSINTGYDGACQIQFITRLEHDGMLHAINACQSSIRYEKTDFFVVVCPDELNTTANILIEISSDCELIVGLRHAKDLSEVLSSASMKVEEGQILDFIEKPSVNKYGNDLCETGVYVYGTKFAEIIKEVATNPEGKTLPNGELSIGSAILRAIEQNLLVKGTIETGVHIHLTSLEDVARYCS
jgi:dTDP-glucose pyrophosphorylase